MLSFGHFLPLCLNPTATDFARCGYAERSLPEFVLFASDAREIGTNEGKGGTLPARPANPAELLKLSRPTTAPRPGEAASDKPDDRGDDAQA
jgi:hypothetical protein